MDEWKPIHLRSDGGSLGSHGQHQGNHCGAPRLRQRRYPNPHHQVYGDDRVDADAPGAGERGQRERFLPRRYSPGTQAGAAEEAGGGCEAGFRRHGEVPRVCSHQQCQPNDMYGGPLKHCKA